MLPIDYKSFIRNSKYFTWHEALWLNKWQRYANESDGLTQIVLDSIEHFVTNLNIVRESLAVPFIVHVWYRPVKYNAEIGGATKSSHIIATPLPILPPPHLDAGKELCSVAVDFHPVFTSSVMVDCKLGREKIIAGDLLNKLGLRMENNGETASWIHLDNAPVIHERYFKP